MAVRRRIATAEWAWSDAWILTATRYVHQRQGATLAQIIMAADFLNRAIPTAAELSRAFSLLVDCGLVRVKNGRYRLGLRQRALMKAVPGKGGLFTQVDNCLKWLKCEGLQPIPSTTVTVSKSAARAAYEVYLAGSWSEKTERELGRQNRNRPRRGPSAKRKSESQRRR